MRGGGGGVGGAAWPTSILFFWGGGGIAKSTYTHACTCTCMHTRVKYSYTHACVCTHACIHAQPMQT